MGSFDQGRFVILTLRPASKHAPKAKIIPKRGGDFMKKRITLSGIISFVLVSFLLNSYLLVKHSLYFLALVIPLFLWVSLFPGTMPKGTKKLRLRLCSHGSTLLSLFALSLIPSLCFHAVLAFLLLPTHYTDLLFSLLYCVILSALLFWNGILCV